MDGTYGMTEGEESEIGTIDGDRLEFESIVWTRQ